MNIFVQSLVLNKYASLRIPSNTKYLPTSLALSTLFVKDVGKYFPYFQKEMKIRKIKY